MRLTSPPIINLFSVFVQKLRIKIAFRYLSVRPEVESKGSDHPHPPPNTNFVGVSVRKLREYALHYSSLINKHEYAYSFVSGVDRSQSRLMSVHSLSNSHSPKGGRLVDGRCLHTVNVPPDAYLRAERVIPCTDS